VALKDRVQDFRSMHVAYKEEKIQKDKHDAFINTIDQMTNKLNALKKEIEDKSRLYHELGSQRRQSISGSAAQ